MSNTPKDVTLDYAVKNKLIENGSILTVRHRHLDSGVYVVSRVKSINVWWAGDVPNSRDRIYDLRLECGCIVSDTADARVDVESIKKRPMTAGEFSMLAEYLEGENACNFHYDPPEPENINNICWTCDKSLQFTERWFASRPHIDELDAIRRFDKMGARCDCEILFNVKDWSNDATSDD